MRETDNSLTVTLNLPLDDNQNTEVDTEIKSTQEDKKQIPFNPLRTSFRKNGMGYRLMLRNHFKVKV